MGPISVLNEDWVVGAQVEELLVESADVGGRQGRCCCATVVVELATHQKMIASESWWGKGERECSMKGRIPRRRVLKADR